MVVYRFKNWGECFHLWSSRGKAEGGEGGFSVYVIIFIPRGIITNSQGPPSITPVDVLGNHLETSKDRRALRSLGLILRIIAVDTDRTPQMM